MIVINRILIAAFTNTVLKSKVLSANINGPEKTSGPCADILRGSGPNQKQGGGCLLIEMIQLLLIYTKRF